jgi:NAD(P)-dependent dehydrogenase (short-subunit alcohol dehydrogenase family)
MVGGVEDIKNLVSKGREEFGRIDVLANNAGTNPATDSAVEIEEGAWDAIMSLQGTFLSQSGSSQGDEGARGCIINVSSAAGIRPSILPIYSMSRAGV